VFPGDMTYAENNGTKANEQINDNKQA